MPLIELKITEERVTPKTKQELLAALTEALVSVYGEEIRDHTWVVIDPVSSSGWGVGGRALARVTT